MAKNLPDGTHRDGRISRDGFNIVDDKEYIDSQLKSPGVGFINNWIENAYNVNLNIKRLKDINNNPIEYGKGVPSIFNRYALFQYRGIENNTGGNIDDYKDNINSRFINDKLYKEYALTPTVSKIINYFNNIEKNVAYTFDYSDFLYNKYYGKISNNYMICVRRFPTPCIDNILEPIAYDSKTDTIIENKFPDLARAITYLGEAAGNKIEDVIKFDVKFKWEEIESKIQTIESKEPGIQGSKILMGGSGMSGRVLRSVGGLGFGVSAAAAQQREQDAGFDYLMNTYPNYVLGPLNIIKKMNIQGQGLEFEYEVKLRFNYVLKSYGDINPKMAFLDLMSNLLVLTYNNAPWWGGGNRIISNGNFGNPLGDRKKLENGDIKGFLSSVFRDLGGMLGNIFGNGKGGFDLNSILGGLGAIASDILGGWLGENVHSPHAAFALNALLSGEPTGYWHITIGNPFSPVIMMGNMILTNTSFKFKGPFGVDDFPSELEVEMTFKPARPRDKAEIETMFNAGRGKLYYMAEGQSDILNLSGKENPHTPSGYSNKKRISDFDTRKENGNNKGVVETYKEQIEDAYNYLKARNSSRGQRSMNDIVYSNHSKMTDII